MIEDKMRCLKSDEIWVILILSGKNRGKFANQTRELERELL